MNINPYFISKKAIELISSYKTQIDKVIYDFERNKSLSLFMGIRPTIPNEQFPSFEIESSSVSTEWGTARGQRHTCSFKCLVTVSCPKIEIREEYICAMASAVTSILKNPRNLQFPIYCDNPIDDRGKYSLTVYDSMVNDTAYSSAREGTIGIAEFTWVVKVHEKMADILFSTVPDQLPNIIKPIIKEVG